MNALNASAYIPLGGMLGSETVLNASVTGLSTLADSMVVFSCIGIEFYQEVNGQMYILSAGNAMKIQAVY